MRPELLFPLFAPLSSLSGVGPRIAKLLEKAAGPHVVDVLWHLPREVVDRGFSPPIAEAPAGRIVTIKVTVDRHFPPPDKRRPYRVTCHDDTGVLTLTFFHADKKYLERELPVGEQRLVSGRIEYFRSEAQIAHPDFIARPEQAASIPKIEPVYPLTTGLTPKVLRKAVLSAVSKAPALPEWLDPEYKKRQGWPSWKEAIEAAHNPQAGSDVGALTQTRQRIAFDELLASQLALAITRAKAKKLPGRVIEGDKRLRAMALKALPFKLTGSQVEALKEIGADMASTSRMLRLLQGDVGSGKTVVALFAMLNAIECGGQAALLAPTEILARQHFETIEPLAKAAGIRAAVLTGRDKGKARKALLEKLASGDIQILIGTHAIFQDDVAFKDLMLAVIDEQHRFGVHQRLALAGKGKGVDMLVMTATPIPRTLMLSAYGDLDVSRLRDKPPGRKPVDTRLVPNGRLDDVANGIGRAIQSGAKVYWVCPLVEDSEVLDLAAATERYEDLKHRFGEAAVSLVHGKMKAAEKDAAMARFVDGPAQILVATTVIEVGVNVPAATVMVIEHAERFGLAQLHQLRGRIGRGEAASTCLLVYAKNLTETAERRLKTMRETEDGFVIAEEDLRLRGAGELLGTRQSGLPVFKLADLAVHGELLAAARDDARLIIERDPDLSGERGKALRVLLYLFERDAAVATLRSG
ncbi:ATP-dependent DNA helicase RecG [Hwanghaeella sp.]|uniref:ATP-dependent DNA helicase RecG n=1 Tax=Hwanghaeella sp. TaxID=2605943 RepID=UPI003CCC2E43